MASTRGSEQIETLKQNGNKEADCYRHDHVLPRRGCSFDCRGIFGFGETLKQNGNKKADCCHSDHVSPRRGRSFDCHGIFGFGLTFSVSLGLAMIVVDLASSRAPTEQCFPRILYALHRRCTSTRPSLIRMKLLRFFHVRFFDVVEV